MTHKARCEIIEIPLHYYLDEYYHEKRHLHLSMSSISKRSSEGLLHGYTAWIDRIKRAMIKLGLAGCILVAISIGFLVGWGMFLDFSYILILPFTLLGLILVRVSERRQRVQNSTTVMDLSYLFRKIATRQQVAGV